MNQQQRKFLIDKIEKQIQTTKEALKQSALKPPSLSNYLLNAVMSGNFEIKSTEEIKAMIVAKAKAAKAGENWMNNSSSAWGNSDSEINFNPAIFFILPQDYVKLRNEYDAEIEKAEIEYQNFKLKAESFIVRLNLASDKTLEKMISEVDNMGDITLLDTKLKYLSE